MVIILCPVDIAEGAVAHLFYERPSLETGISRESAFVLALFSHYAFEYGTIVVFLLLLAFLLCVDSAGSGVSSFGRHIPVVDCGGGIVTMRCIGLQRLMIVDIRVAGGVPGRCGLGCCVILVPATVLLGVDVGNVSGGLILRGAAVTGLFAMPDEVFEVLNGRHG